MIATAPYRVRHETRMRLLEVVAVEPITPRMARVTLGGAALEGFVSAAHDDHVKLFFPAPGEDRPTLPTPSPNGPVYAEGVTRPAARDYTPRRYDSGAGTLAIDFVLHGDGPATSWAAQAKPGQMLGLGGPRGSLVVGTDYDWYLLAGDEAALPAIGRRLEELPAGARALVVVEIEDEGEQQKLASAAQVDTIWLHRDAPVTADLLNTVASLTMPAGTGYAWVAAEAAVAKALRRHLVEERGIPKDQVRAAAYWKRGDVAVHENYND
jgi:NADPH-dependent ferric siderophore reductase